MASSGQNAIERLRRSILPHTRIERLFGDP